MLDLLANVLAGPFSAEPVSFQVSNGGTATPAEAVELGVYETTVTTGTQPGENVVAGDALDVRVGA